LPVPEDFSVRLGLTALAGRTTIEVMKTLVIECPDKLLESLDRLVRDGWVETPSQAVIEALRRFLQSHRTDLLEAQVHDDVEWGLHGND